MPSPSEIKQVFKDHLETEVPIPVARIHEIFEANSNLTAADWEPHPAEVNRGSNYPKWKRSVQAVLYRLKMAGKIKHFKESNEYVFYGSTFAGF